MDINGFSNQDAFQIIEDLAITDSHGEGVVTNEDPLSLNKDEVVQAMQELGMSESDSEKTWDMLANGEDSISKEDFDLKEYADVEEVAGANMAVMQQLNHLMMSQVTETDEAELTRMVRD